MQLGAQITTAKFRCFKKIKEKMKRNYHDDSDSEEEHDNHTEMSDDEPITMSPHQKRNKIFSKLSTDDVKTVSVLPDDFKSKIGYIDTQQSFLKNSSAGFSLEGRQKFDFYFVDACEMDGRVILFGKVESVPNNYVSCCVRLEQVQKTIYFLPREPIDMALVTQQVEDSIYQELSEVLKISQDKFGFKLKKRKYIFEDPDVEYNKDLVMAKVVIWDIKSLKTQLLSEFRGSKLFSKVFHASTGGLEDFILKRKLMGPSWLTIENFTVKTTGQLSWCKAEVSIPEASSVTVSSSDRIPPPLVLMSLKVKTVHNDEKNVNEIAAVCGIVQEYSFANQSSERKKFIIARKIDETSVDSEDVQLELNETSLINRVFAQIQLYDPDMFIGHSFLSFELDILLQRWKSLRGTDGVLWSRIGRLKLGKFPMLQPGPGGMSESTRMEKDVLVGRLVCDTYLAVKEYLREKSYSLEDLRVSQLGESPLDKELRNPLYDGHVNVTAKYFSTPDGVNNFCAFVEHDAQVAMDLMEKLSLIPLSKELTNAAGNLWNKTLTGSRSERIEFLLLHEFHKQKYILPDKLRSSGPKARGGKRPKYSGGLVLEPKSGFHHNYVLLLDFNSLYPSIILEKNICFTNFLYNDDEKEAHKSDKTILPQVIQSLLDKRRSAQRKMEQATGVQRWQLDMKQRALKLTANSTYGCLGFVFSRFYCKQMAESITVEGRNILTLTKQLIENNLRYSVIYGDTDSVMIATDSTDYEESMKKGEEIKQQVNDSFKKGKGKLEIDVDGLFRRMLLLRKKKYGALIHTKNKEGKIVAKLELKGLDMVRRDWCDLSRNVSQYIIDQILRPDEDVNCTTQPTPEEIVSNIHTHLREIADDVRNNRVSLDQFVLSKALTKEPEQYTDAINHPHVQVALEMKRNGQAVRLQQRIPFVITLKKDGTSSAKVSERAVHPEVFVEEHKKGSMDLDYEWYLSQQVFPPVSRLCEHLQQTDRALLAECLGLEKKYYRVTYGDDENLDEYKILSRQEDVDENEFENISLPKEFICESCSKPVKFDISEQLKNAVQNNSFGITSHQITLMSCPHCNAKMSTGRLINTAQLNIRQLQKQYYCNELKPSASNYRANITDSTTHVISMQPGGYGVFNGAVVSVKQLVSPQDLQLRLRYLARMFDWAGSVKATFKKIDKEQYSSLEKLKAIAQEMQKSELEEMAQVHQHIMKYLKKNARQMVNLDDLFKLFNAIE